MQRNKIDQGSNKSPEPVRQVLDQFIPDWNALDKHLTAYIGIKPIDYMGSLTDRVYELEQRTFINALRSPKFPYKRLVLASVPQTGKSTIKVNLLRSGFDTSLHYVTRLRRPDETAVTGVKFVSKSRLADLERYEKVFPITIHKHGSREREYYSGLDKQHTISLFKEGKKFVLEKQLKSWLAQREALQEVGVSKEEIDTVLIVFLVPPSFQALAERSIARALQLLAPMGQVGDLKSIAQLCTSLDRSLSESKLIIEAMDVPQVVFIVNDYADRVLQKIFLLSGGAETNQSLNHRQLRAINSPRIDMVLHTLISRAFNAGLPAVLLQHGSTVYADIEHASDLDLYVIVDAAFFVGRTVQTIFDNLGITVQALSTDRKDTDDLLAGTVTRLQYKFSMNDIDIDMKVTTFENLTDQLSNNGKFDYTTRTTSDHAIEDYKYFIDYTGKPHRIRYVLIGGTEYTDRRIPQRAFNATTDVKIVPSLIENLVLSHIIYDETVTKYWTAIGTKLFYIVIERILRHNGLYNGDGSIKEEAFEPDYMLRLFTKTNRFTSEFRQSLGAQYLLTLNLMQLGLT